MEAKEVKLETTKVEAPAATTGTNNDNTRRVSRNNLLDGQSFEDFLNQQLTFPNYSTQKLKASAESTHILEPAGKTSSSKEDVSKNEGTKQQNQNVEQSQSTSKSSNNYIVDRSTDNMIRLEAKDLSAKDLDQLQQLINNPNIAININQINGLNSSNIFYNNSGINSKTLTFSKQLSETIQNAYKSNRPVRISIEKDTSVILRFDKDGNVSAKFISSDKAMEMLIKDNLYLLKAKLEKEGLPHNELSYSDHQREKEEKQEEDS